MTNKVERSPFVAAIYYWTGGKKEFVAAKRLPLHAILGLLLWTIKMISEAATEHPLGADWCRLCLVNNTQPMAGSLQYGNESYNILIPCEYNNIFLLFLICIFL